MTELDSAPLSRWGKLLRLQVDLYHLCARRLHENNLIALSAALSFRTIFALIPLLILVFLMLKAMGVVDDGKRALRDFLVTTGMAQIVASEAPPPPQSGKPGEPLNTPSREINGETGAHVLRSVTSRPNGEMGRSVPTTTESEPSASQPAEEVAPQSVVFSVADQIASLVERVERQLTVRRVGPIGVLLMIWTALGFLMTLEEALNRVFGAPRNRSVARRILLYWTALTLGPLAIVSVNYLGRYLVEVFEHVPGISGVALLFDWAAPILVGMIVVAMLYKLMPNTRVPFRSAFWGAALTVPVWMIARWGFAIYVERFVLPGNVYGVLGAIPLFLFWLNISWSIFLFGAEIAHAATNLGRLRAEQNAENLLLGPTDWLTIAAAIARRFHAGEGPARLDQLAGDARIPEESVRRVLERLVASGLFCETGEEDPSTPEDEHGYIPTRPPERIAVADLLNLADSRSIEASPELRVLYDRMRESLNGATLAQLVSAA